jgi:hypothetical protein
MARKLPRVHPGDPISADFINRLVDEVERLGRITVDRLTMTIRDDATGIALGVAPAAAGGAASYAVSAAGIGAGVAGTAELIAPDGTSRGFATVTNGWHGPVDPGVRFLVVRDIGGGWIAGPYECTVA